ncbi:MAG: hypothetical protein M9936_23820, partial [Caldilinea sp.]|nr:hypothetical protein [Caldilinea sp.]
MTGEGVPHRIRTCQGTAAAVPSCTFILPVFALLSPCKRCVVNRKVVATVLLETGRYALTPVIP